MTYSSMNHYEHFLLLAVVNKLTNLLAGWKIAASVDKWTIAFSINEQILQHKVDSITRWIMQQFS